MWVREDAAGKERKNKPYLLHFFIILANIKSVDSFIRTNYYVTVYFKQNDTSTTIFLQQEDVSFGIFYDLINI